MHSEVLTIYTRPGCGPCTATKRALEKAGIPFREIEVESVTPEQLDSFRAEGLTQAPVVIAPDGRAWSGFRPDEISKS